MVALMVIALLRSAENDGTDALEKAKSAQVRTTADSFNARVESSISSLGGLGARPWDLTPGSAADKATLNTFAVDPDALSGTFLVDANDTVTNGVLLRPKQARLMKTHGIQGASLSLDSVDAARHDAFRHLPGAWKGAIRATDALRAESIDFSLHMSVTDWNVGEIPAMIDLARELGARVLNFFFLVRTGRGEGLTDITPAQYEEILTHLARAQGAGSAAATGVPDSVLERREDPWSAPVGRAGGLLIRAKCAPHFRRVLYELDPASPLLANYAHGSCPAGKYYCRITPTGDVTPCPYMPVSAGNLRETGFAELWERAEVFTELRHRPLGGRCGACEFRELCGGCRCRAYATYGDYLAEDPACGYQPGAHGGQLIRLGVEQTFGLEVRFALAWKPAAQSRLDAIPAFARAMVVQAVEAYARGQGQTTVTPSLLAEVRSRWGISPGRPFTPASGRPTTAGDG